MALTVGLRTSAVAEQALETTVLQTIAHELRQPLSAIESIAYYLGMVLPRGEERAREHVVRLQRLIEQANWILESGLQLADDSPLNPEPVDLEELITQTVTARVLPSDPQPQLMLAGNLPTVELDPGRGRALIENLLALFLQIASDAHPVRLRTWANGSVTLEISTTAPGYESETALGPGCTLGLDSAQRIVQAHGGCLTIVVNPVTGIRLRVVL